MEHIDATPSGAPFSDASTAAGLVTYALVTAAHNEAAFIERILRSVTSQTVLPTAWVIVDDGSSDETAAIARAHARRHAFIDVISLPRGRDRSFVSKVWAVHEGLKRLGARSIDFIGNLDADIDFDVDYFSRLIDHARADPSLGIVGGWILEPAAGGFAPRPFNSTAWVPHAVQLVRGACFDAIGPWPVLPYGGEDVWAAVAARMHGWDVRSFPDLPVRHYRPTSTASGVLHGRFRTGRLDRSLGYHPLYELIKQARRVRTRPYVIGSAVALAGFAWAALTRETRPVSDDLVRFLRDHQLRELTFMMRHPFRERRPDGWRPPFSAPGRP